MRPPPVRGYAPPPPVSAPLLYRLELPLRRLAAWVLAWLFWRPGRRGFASQLASAKRVVLLRLDNRVGEALLTTPLVTALAGRCQVDLLVHPKCVRVLEGLPGSHEVLPLERKWLLWGPLHPEVRRLRAWTKGAVVINAANWASHSGTAAIAARLLSPRSCVVGPAVMPAGALADVAVAPLPGIDHELTQRAHLLTALAADLTAGPMAFREPRASASVEQVVRELGARFAVVNPGGRLGERRVPAEAFAAACRWLSSHGVTPVVTWGPGEEALADAVLSGVAGAVRAPPTSLDELGFLMKRAQVVVCNNTGPMHLSVAVGARTVALFYKMPISRWGHPGARHRMVDLTPCDGLPAMAAQVEAALAGVVS